MKTVALLLVGLLACAAAYEVEILTEEEFDRFMADPSVTPETRGLILNGQAKKAVKGVLEQMPCGWPDAGIPPLAPYTNEDLQIHVAKSFADALMEMIRFRFDGLDQMKIKKLKVSYTFSKKVKYHFQFKELKATAQLFKTDTFVDFMNQLGISVRYEGSGPMQFSLDDLQLQGSFKYKMPLFWGSIKIYKFECIVSLGGVRSNIGGILGNGAVNEMINDEIEMAIPAFINGNQKEISARIEQELVPRVNAFLKGKKLWDLIFGSGSSGSSTKCVPTPAPWLAEV